MDIEQFDYFCRAQAKVSSVLVRVYSDSSLSDLLNVYGNKYYNEMINTIPVNMTAKNFAGQKNIALIDETQFMLGYINEEKTGHAILVGPVRMGEVTNSDIYEIMKKYNIPKLFEQNIMSFLFSTPIVTLEHFLMLLSLFNLAANDKIVHIRDLFDINNDVTEVAPKKEDYIETVDVEVPHTSGDYETTITYYIKNGMVDEIENLQFESYSGQVGKLGPNRLRSLKNAVIILNSICLRAAISGGLDTETAYSLGERYAQKIESSTSIPELGKLTAIIRKDYCQRVKNLIIPKIDNIYIRKVSDHIQNHIYEKITVSELAKIVGISPEYLSSLAKQYLHCTLPQYINKMKISEAKKLLRFTNKSLSEIAILLSFSSQSHFQNQFKKIRGITPAEYREKYQVVIKKDK